LAGVYRYSEDDVSLRLVLSKFWTLLENDSVRPFISLYYIPWLAWAVLATFLFPPVTIIETAMGHGVYVLWVWATIPGTAAPMVGLAMRHGGSSVADISTRLLFRDWMGLWLQAVGHAVVCVLLILFEVSAVIGAMDYAETQGKTAGMTILVTFLLSAYTVGTALLSMQCLRKLWKGEQLRRSRT
jgi:hypothetical protein